MFDQFEQAQLRYFEKYTDVSAKGFRISPVYTNQELAAIAEVEVERKASVRWGQSSNTIADLSPALNIQLIGSLTVGCALATTFLEEYTTLVMRRHYYIQKAQAKN